MITEKTKENAGPEEEGAGMAMALKDASYTDSEGTTYKYFIMRDKDYWDLSNNVNAEMYGNNINASKFIYNDFRGYYYTWNPEALSEHFKTTYPNTPQAEIPLYPTEPHAFWAAGHYNSGVIQTGSALSKWFLPTAAEMILALRKLKIADVQLSDFGPEGIDHFYWETRANDLAFSKNVFTKVGGDVLFYNLSYRDIWTSSDSDGSLYHYTVRLADDWKTQTYQVLANTIERNYDSYRVRPFIYF